MPLLRGVAAADDTDKAPLDYFRCFDDAARYIAEIIAIISPPLRRCITLRLFTTPPLRLMAAYAAATIRHFL